MLPKDALDNLRQADTEVVIEHVLTRYHDVHREQLPELIRLAQRVERVHNHHPDCPAGLSAHLEQMQAELEAHMQKEEQILFPMIARNMNGMAAAPISVMRREHDDRGLATLENDLVNHIHLENNVLFNRVGGQAEGAHHG